MQVVEWGRFRGRQLRVSQEGLREGVSQTNFLVKWVDESQPSSFTSQRVLRGCLRSQTRQRSPANVDLQSCFRCHYLGPPPLLLLDATPFRQGQQEDAQMAAFNHHPS